MRAEPLAGWLRFASELSHFQKENKQLLLLWKVIKSKKVLTVDDIKCLITLLLPIC